MEFTQPLKKHWPLICLVILALITRFLFLWYPSQVVFDELYFGSFVQSYFSHQYYFDIHPPLGKLMIFGFLKIFGAGANFNYSAIGSALPAAGAFMLRFLPALFGVLLVILVYLLAKKIGLSRKSAFLAAWMVLFDNAIATQSKFTLLDIFLIFFGFLSLYFLLCFTKSQKYLFFALAIFFAALSASIKWTGLAFMAVIWLFCLIDLVRQFHWKKLGSYTLIALIIPLLVYGLVFTAHFSLIGQPAHGIIPAIQKIIDINKEMFHANATLKATHPYSSKWFQWPLMRRPIWYWTQTQDGTTANIWLIGNPIVWFSALLAVILSIIISFSRKLREKLPQHFYLLLFGYGISFLPLMFVGRVMFLYHYLPALVFGILITAVLYDKLIPKNNMIFLGYLLIVCFAFLGIAPINYGIPLSANANRIYSVFVNFFL